MFNSKKKETNPTRKAMVPNGSHSLNTLVKGTVVEGTIKSESDIRVDGVIKGALTCKAKVIIGPTGSVEGDIKCENAVIEGHFDGNLQVTELLNVRETAQVSGDVRTNKLIVQSGAIFSVTCKMGVKASNNGKFESVKASKPVVKVAEKQRV